MKGSALRAVALAGALVVMLAGSASAGPHYSAWTAADKIDDIAGNSSELNTPSLDGCPIQAPDGLSLYMASNRPGGLGGTGHLGRPPARHDGPVGGAGEPRGAGQLGGR